MPKDTARVVIVGAGIAGLAAALRLSHAGCAVTVLEQHASAGGKMRTVPSAAGPIDAGPTVLTMRNVFETLFRDVGADMSDHITLTPLQTLARHYWSDGTLFDLHADATKTTENIAGVFGARAANDYARFRARAARLFAAFEAPMMQTAAPRQADLTAQVLRQPRLISDMAPHQSLARMLRGAFKEPKLAQLFGRYATYVGGSPFTSPAILSLISEAEAQGVWAVGGGMHRLARVIEKLATTHGARFRYETPVTRITKQNGQVTGVETPQGHVPADIVVFNGDPRALATGHLGQAMTQAVSADAVTPRSLSAHVMAFAAAPRGTELSHHTVFFADDEAAEFDALTAGQVPDDATLYVCAQDHGTLDAQDLQRFEIIRNAPPLPISERDSFSCQTLIFRRLERFGLTFSPTPDTTALTDPATFDQLFPASSGSLYGRSPQGMTSAFKRPTARTRIPGLYLCGGGAHPGAGVPMATLSAQHVAAAIMTDLSSRSTSRPTAMPGGMSMGSATVAARPSRSSGL